MNKELYYIQGIINGIKYTVKLFDVSMESAQVNAERIAGDYLQSRRCNDEDMIEVTFEPKSPYY